MVIFGTVLEGVMVVEWRYQLGKAYRVSGSD